MRMHADVRAGYMTVEAAFVIPWVIFIIVWILYLGYFEYDRCLIFQDDYALATQTAARIAADHEKQEWLDAHIPGQIGSKYMGTRGVNTSGNVSSSQVVISSSFTVSHPLSFHAGMIPASNWNVSDEVSADNFSFTRRLRMFRMAGRVWDGITE